MERSEEGHYVFMYIIEGDTVDRKDTYIHIYIYEFTQCAFWLARAR